MFRTASIALLLAMTLGTPLSLGETLTYRVTSEDETVFDWSGGLPGCRVAGELEGVLKIFVDNSTGEARLDLSKVIIRSARSVPLSANQEDVPKDHFCNEVRDNLEGSAISEIDPLFADGLLGAREGDGAFAFGSFPLGSTLQRNFLVGSFEGRTSLTGFASFGLDAPNYSLNATLQLVPEPSSACPAIVGLMALTFRSRKRDRQ